MMLDVQGLRTGYGRIPILNGVSFSVTEGEFVGILGHNGMGKTTLLKALMGFLPATGGRVMFGHDDVTAVEPYRRARLGLGYVPQGREIFPGLTVYENLRMGCSTQDGVEADIIAAVLEEFPRLKALLDRTGGALSGGEQQLLAIARADADLLRRFCAVPVRLLQCLHDQLPFGVLDGHSGANHVDLAQIRRRTDCRRHVTHGQPFGTRQNHHLLDGVAQFPHVARPVIRLKRVRRFRRQFADLLVVLPVELIQKRLHQQRDIIPPFP
jgi:ABC-type transport system involved in cytochrome c biogenesis ATPase subunit